VATVLANFPKLYQPEKSQPKYRRRLFSSVAVSLFPERARCYSINSTQLNLAQVWLSVYWCNVVQRDGETVSGKELKFRGQKSTLDIHLFKALAVYDVPRLGSLQHSDRHH